MPWCNLPSGLLIFFYAQSGHEHVHLCVVIFNIFAFLVVGWAYVDYIFGSVEVQKLVLMSFFFFFLTQSKILWVLRYSSSYETSVYLIKLVHNF